jgi:hypothetical protein
MRLREVTTPEEDPDFDSDEDYKSVLRNVVLPVLGSLALAAVSLAILYAFFRHFKQKRKAKETRANHPYHSRYLMFRISVWC